MVSGVSSRRQTNKNKKVKCADNRSSRNNSADCSSAAELEEVMLLLLVPLQQLAQQVEQPPLPSLLWSLSAFPPRQTKRQQHRDQDAQGESETPPSLGRA